MDLAEDFLEYIVQSVLKDRAAELKVLERDITKLQNVKKPLPTEIIFGLSQAVRGYWYVLLLVASGAVARSCRGTTWT